MVPAAIAPVAPTSSIAPVAPTASISIAPSASISAISVPVWVSVCEGIRVCQGFRICKSFRIRVWVGEGFWHGLHHDQRRQGHDHHQQECQLRGQVL
ncbi:hypothetical protein E2C01_043387 [Portunus trituberculatus]|uniref:Uncharacterized protein n=1 Tax=Portunus trituberculatus TaxID=210409 RepID=A0A5B7FPC3_PORTR|nr:hypothetical protein [Portunus trituberculatus]